MRLALAAIAALAALAAAAQFKSERWLAERGDDSDMLRLRAAYAECVKKIDSAAEDISLPLETYPEGAVKSRLMAGRAQVFADSGYVWGENIRVEQYSPEGVVTARLTAENCLVDRNTKTGWVEGEAQMVYGESSVRGRGIYFSLPREFIKIFSQSEIRTKGGQLNKAGSLIK